MEVSDASEERQRFVKGLTTSSHQPSSTREQSDSLLSRTQPETVRFYDADDGNED